MKQAGISPSMMCADLAELKQQVQELALKLLAFEYPIQTDGQKKQKVVALHASSRKTSNSLLLWDQVRQHLEPSAQIREISLRNGSMLDCRGCPYEECLHYGENDGCFYGGIMTEQVYPAILECDVLIMICPNYNDAVGANLTAFINRMTAIFNVRRFYDTDLYGVIVSGYSGSDIVAQQLISSLCMNKSFRLPARFAMMETANDPRSIFSVPGIEERAEQFAKHILCG
jgi:multimeric flavodoxin WrbA